MKLRLPLLVLLAAFSSSANAATMHGVSIIDKITYTVEDLDENDGIAAIAEEYDWYAPFAEFDANSSIASASGVAYLKDTGNFLRVSPTPPYNFLVGIYGGDTLGSLNLFSNFSAAVLNYGKILNSRHFKVSPNTRLRFKTKMVLQGAVANEGPEMPEQAGLTLKANVLTYKNGNPYQNILYSKLLTQSIGSVMFKHDVEMTIENDTENETTLSIYYEVVNHGVDGE